MKLIGVDGFLGMMQPTWDPKLAVRKDVLQGVNCFKANQGLTIQDAIVPGRILV